eukprot:scaffold25019_cov45-Attheya_sp.AAC.1
MQEKDKQIVKEVQGEGSGEEEVSLLVSENTGMSSSTGENQEAASMSDNDEARRKSVALNNSRREEGRQNMMSAILQAPKTRETRTSETRTSWSSTTALPAKTRSSIEKEEEIQRQDEQLRMLVESETASAILQAPKTRETLTSWSSATGLPAKTRASIEKEEEIRRQDEQLRMLIESETASVVEKEPNPFQRETTLLASYLESTGKKPLAVEITKYTESILSSSPYRRLSDLDNTKTTTSLKRPEALNKRLQGRAEKMGALIRSMSSSSVKGLDDSEQANIMESQGENSNNVVPGAFPVQGRAYGGLPNWAFNRFTSSIPIRPQRHAPRRHTSHDTSMISNDEERPDEPDDDDVENARRYTESQRNRNVVSSAVTRLSNQSNQYEETQPEMEPIEILEARAITVSDRFQYDDDDHEQPVFLATEIESTSTKWFKDKRFLRAVVFFSISMCILLLLFVATYRSSPSNTKTETSDPSMSPMPSMSPTLSPTVSISPTVNSDAIQMGTIPASIGALSLLKEIDLGENELTGILSKEARNLKFLHTLRLSNNKLSGSVPTTLSELQDMKVLSLANNLLEGTIPISFENLTLDAISFDT